MLQALFEIAAIESPGEGFVEREVAGETGNGPSGFRAGWAAG
jgi:hypothetical protein